MTEKTHYWSAEVTEHDHPYACRRDFLPTEARRISLRP